MFHFPSYSFIQKYMQTSKKCLLNTLWINFILECPDCICVPFLHSLMKILRNIDLLTPAQQQLMGTCFHYHAWFFVISVSGTSYKNLHTKIYPNSHLIKNLSRDIIYWISWRYLLVNINNAAFSRQVKYNLSIKTHCEIPLNITQQLYNIQIMNIRQHPQSITLITVGCCKIR